MGECISYNDLQQMVKELQIENERLTEENLNLKMQTEDYNSAREILNSKETEETWKKLLEDKDDPYNSLVNGFIDYYSEDNEVIHIAN